MKKSQITAAVLFLLTWAFLCYECRITPVHQADIDLNIDTVLVNHSRIPDTFKDEPRYLNED